MRPDEFPNFEAESKRGFAHDMSQNGGVDPDAARTKAEREPGQEQAGKAGLVAAELAKLHEHLLARSASGYSRPHPRRPSEVTGPPAAARNTSV